MLQRPELDCFKKIFHCHGEGKDPTRISSTIRSQLQIRRYIHTTYKCTPPHCRFSSAKMPGQTCPESISTYFGFAILHLDPKKMKKTENKVYCLLNPFQQTKLTHSTHSNWLNEEHYRIHALNGLNSSNEKPKHNLFIEWVWSKSSPLH